MDNEQRVRLWDAINRYATACGGDPGRAIYGNAVRQAAVAEVEQIIRDISATANCERCDAVADVQDMVEHMLGREG